jgi:hypothetical protein
MTANPTSLLARYGPVAVTLAAALVLVLVPSGLAAKGGNGGNGGKPSGGTLDLVVLDGTDTAANHRERVTFVVSTTATDRPFVGLKCWQGPTGVYNSSMGVFPEYLFDPWLTLDSSYWTPGLEANCTARLYHYNKRGYQVELVTMTFTVAP